MGVRTVARWAVAGEDSAAAKAAGLVGVDSVVEAVEAEAGAGEEGQEEPAR